MSEVQQDKENLDERLNAAQIEKIKLEIERMRTRGVWEQRLTSYTPLISVLIAISGFLWGIYQFQKQQSIQQDQRIIEQQKDRTNHEREQKIRIQSQIGTDMQQILRFTSDKKQSLSTIVFLLQEVDNLARAADNDAMPDCGSFFKRFFLCGIDPEQDKNASGDTSQRRKITTSLVEMVKNECNFEEKRDIQFANIVAEFWPDDYGQYLKSDPDVLAYIIDRYILSLHEHVTLSPSYYRKIKYKKIKRDVENNWDIPDDAKDAYKVSKDHFDIFEDLILGIQRHTDFFEQNSDRRNYHIKNFQIVICNPTLTEQLFGTKFSESDPEIAKACNNPAPNKSFNRTRP